MTADQFLAELEAANPRLFEAEKIIITVESFRAQIRRAHAAGMLATQSVRAEPPNFWELPNFMDSFSEKLANTRHK